MAFVSYDSYKNRIEKLAKVKAFIVRFKFLIIGVLAVLIAGIASLLATKGMITSAMVLPTQITYGEAYYPDGASAFLSDVTYEYCEQGTDGWTDKKPIKAGKYLARTVTNKAVGKGYGDPVAYEILPKEIEFVFKNNETDGLVYGSAPDRSDYEVTGLITEYGDRIGGVDFKYDYDDANSKTGVTVNEGAVKIENSIVGDCSGCYTYSAKSTSYALVAKNISFRLADVTETYKGDGFVIVGRADAATLSARVGEDEFVFTTKITKNGAEVQSPENADIYGIELVDGVKILSGGKDVTSSRYNISVIDGATFTIDRKPVTVTTQSASRNYNGLPLTAEGGTSDGLISGHTLSQIGVAPSVTEVREGTVKNEQHFDIFKGTERVTDNYDINYDYGNLKITPCPITVTTEGEEWTYNGQAHSTNGEYKITAGALANGQTLNVLNYKQVINVKDSGVNTLEFDILSGGAYVDLTNYDITRNFGTLTINKRPITVNTGSDSFEYDGNNHAYDYSSIDSTFIEDGSLALSSHSLQIKGSPATVKNVADTKDENNKTAFKVVSGGWLETDESDNYLITYNYGTLTVTPRKITVVVSPAEKVYDGTPLSSTAYTTRYYGNTALEGIVDGSTLTPVESTVNSIINQGNTENAVKFTSSSNYEIKNYDRTAATLTVTQRPITVVVTGAQKFYDGTPLSSTAYTTHYFGDPLKAGLVSDGSTLMPVESTINSITNASSVQNNVEFTSSSNYIIKDYDRTAATLTVKQVSLSVKLKDLTVTYGEEINYEIKTGNYVLMAGALVKGETLKITDVGYNYDSTLRYPEVGGYYISLKSYELLKADGTDSRGNYDIQISSGTLTINKRKITVKLNSYKITYGEDDSYQHGENIVSGSLAVGESLGVFNAAVDWNGPPLHPNAGTHAIVCTQQDNQILNSDGNPAAKNYEITFVNGTLTVEKRKITVTTPTATFTYNGKEQFNCEYAKVGEWAEDEYVNLKGYTKVKNYTPAPVKNEITIEVWYQSWLVTDNYAITYVCGTLKVEKREITVTSNNNEWTYDGAAHFEEGNSVTEGSLVTELNHAITVTSHTEVTEVSEGEKENKLTYAIKEGNTVVTGNYDITPVNGKIKINKRDIEITVNTSLTYGDKVEYKKGDETVQNLVTGQTVQIDATRINYAAPALPDVGEYSVTFPASAIKVLSGGRDVTSNYNVIPREGELTVAKREVTVQLNSYSATYGEDYGYKGGGEKVVSALKLVGGDRLNAITAAPDCAENANVGDYAVKCNQSANLILKQDGTDGTGNYTVKFQNGTLTVTKRTITVKALSYFVKYGDEYAYPAGAGNYEDITAGSLATFGGVAETLEITSVTFEFGNNNPEVGSYAVTPVSCKILKTDGTDGTSNYNVSYADGELTVEQLVIEVTLKELGFEYGDDEKQGKSYAELYAEKVAPVELPYGEKLNLTVGFTKDGETVSPKHAGEYNVKITNEPNENYRLELVNEDKAVLEIVRRVLRVVPEKVTAVYGEKYAYKAGKSNCGFRTSTRPAYGEEIEIFVGYDVNGQAVPEVGSYDAILNGVRVHYSDGTFENAVLVSEPTYNSKDYGFIIDTSSLQDKLEITTKEVTVTLNDIPEAVYGDEISYIKGGETAEGLLTDHTLEIDPEKVTFGSNAVELKLLSVGEYKINAKDGFIKIFSGVTEVTKNYAVKTVNGTLTITARKITLTVGAFSPVIYGEEIPAPEITGTVNGDTVTGELIYKNAEAEYKSADLASVHLPAGNYSVSLDSDNYSFTYANGAPATTQNYVIETVTPAELTVNKRPITIELKDFERVYGVHSTMGLAWDEYESSSVTYLNGEIGEFIAIGGNGLAEGDAISRMLLRSYDSEAGTFNHIRNVGSYDLQKYRITVKYKGITDGLILYDTFNGSVTDTNYEVNLEGTYPTLTITPKQVDVDLGDIKMTYGEKDYALWDYKYTVQTGLAFNETAEISDIRLVGWQDYRWGGLEMDYRLDVGTYAIASDHPDTVTVYDENGAEVVDGSFNYDINLSGNLVIEKKPLTVELSAFDGAPYYYGDGERLVYPTGIGNFVSCEGLAYEQQLEAVISWTLNGATVSAPKNAGTYNYGFDKLNGKIYEKDGTEKLGGIKNYEITCSSKAVTISPLEVEFDVLSFTGDNAKIYDGISFAYPVGYGNYETLSAELPYGESLEIAVGFMDENGKAVTPIDADDYTIYFKAIFEVKAGTNADTVAGNYKPEGYDGTLKINKRPVTVTALDVETVYGDAAVYPDNFTNYKSIGGMGLAGGQSLKISEVNYFYDKECTRPVGETPSAVGTYYIRPSAYLIAKGAEDVTENYDVTPAVGTLTIKARKILLVTNDDEKVYDGTPLYNYGYTAYYLDENDEKIGLANLTEEEVNSIQVKTEYSITHVWESGENRVEYSSDNFEVHTEYGTLTITQREVNVTTESQTWIYDGEEHFWHEAKVEGLAQGYYKHYRILWLESKITDRGAKQNACELSLIEDNEGVDVTADHKISYVFGFITVKPRPIIVVTGDNIGNVYDGNEYSNISYETYLEGDSTKAGLLGGDTLSVLYEDKLKNVGNVDNETTFIPDSFNYEIAGYECGTLEVTPRHISISLISNYGLIYGDKTYPDGFGNFNYADGSEELVVGEKLLVKVSYYNAETTFTTVRDAGEYGVTLSGYEILSADGTDGFGNYVIDDCEDGSIKINPKELTVALSSLEDKVYGEPFAGYADGGSLTDGLEYDDKLSVYVKFYKGSEEVVIGERTSVGTYAVKIAYCTINGEEFDGVPGGVTDCGNYLITFEDGSFEIIPRLVTVGTGNGLWEYDGLTHSNPEILATYYYNDYGKTGVLDGEESVLQYVDGTATEVINATEEGGVANEAKYVLDPDNPLSANYQIKDYECGRLIVTPREITVKLLQLENADYSGEAIEYTAGVDNFTYAEGSKQLVEGEKLEITVGFFENADCAAYAEPKNAGTYYYTYLSATVTDSKGGLENGDRNYNIYCTDVLSVTVNKLNVTISLAMEDVTYDGQSHAYDPDSFTLVSGNFATGETLSVAVDYFLIKDGETPCGEPKNAGEYRISFNAENSTIGGSGAEVNYNITAADDILFTINKKTITITMGAEKRVYDGIRYSYEDENKNFAAAEAADGETIVPVVKYLDGSGKEVVPVNKGVYTVKLASFTVTGANTVAENYSLDTAASVLECNLEITVRKITVTVNDRSIERPATTIDPVADESFVSESNGSFGFTDADLSKLTPVYSYSYKQANGTFKPVSVAEVNAIGDYKVEVKFEGSATVLNNYDITYKAGNLEITARKVAVKAIYTGGEIEYDGEAVDPTSDKWKDMFGYEDKHVGHDDDGFAEGYEPAPRYVFTNVITKKTTNAPVNAGTYRLTVEFPDVDPNEYHIDSSEYILFTIEQRTVRVTVECDLNDYQNLKYSHSLLPKGSIKVTDADNRILEKDRGAYYLYGSFFNLTQSTETEYDLAGDYEIMARLNNEYGNYKIAEDTEWVNKFSVATVRIYVKPVSKSVPYDGKPLYLNKTDFEIFYGGLVSGDSLEITSADYLPANKASTLASIRSVAITRDGEDMTANYSVYLACEEFMKEDGYNSASFKATLSHTALTFSYSQYELSKRNFIYTGKAIELGVELSNSLISYDPSTCGLLAGDRVEVYKLSNIKFPGTTTQWIQLRIYNSKNENVTNLYKLDILNPDASCITVSERALNMEITTDKQTLIDAWNGGNESVLTASGYDGYRVLDGSYYTLGGLTEEGGLLAGTECEVLVSVTDGTLTLKVIVFGTSAFGKRSDKSIGYALNVISDGTGAGATLVSTASLNTPTTTNLEADNSASIGG